MTKPSSSYNKTPSRYLRKKSATFTKYTSFFILFFFLFTSYQFKVYKTAEPRHKEMYYRIENALSIFIELILDKVEVINSNDNFSPVLLIFSNHSLMDDSYYWNKTTIQKYCEDGPLGKIKVG